MNKTSLHTVAGIAGILFCYVVVSWVETSIENAEKDGIVSSKREAAEAKQNAEKAYKMLAVCMNGGALIVGDTNDAIFCDRASYQKGL